MDKKTQFQGKKASYTVFTSAKMNSLLKELTTSQEYEMLDCIFSPQNGVKHAYRNLLGRKKRLTKRQSAVKQLTGALLPPNGTVDWTSVEFGTLESWMQLPFMPCSKCHSCKSTHLFSSTSYLPVARSLGERTLILSLSSSIV